MKVLNFGSLNIDYVYQLKHFVQKGETISSDSLNVFSGGKGLNQSIALCKGGADVYHAGAIGQDGMFLKEILDDVGVNTKFVQVLEDVRSGNAIIQRDEDGDNCIILYGGANQEIKKDFVDSVIKEFSENDWLVLQNEISSNPYIVEQAHKRGMKIILNPAPMNEKIFDINLDYLDCIILNEIEAQELVGKQNTVELCKSLQKRFTNTEIILTLGEEGSIYIYKDSLIKQKAYKVHAVDTTAAGDTFVGFYLAGIGENMSAEEAMDMASKASAITVSRKGAAPSIPERKEVEAFGN